MSSSMVLFSLCPRSPAAFEVVRDPRNKSHLSSTTADVLDVGHRLSSGGDTSMLVTLGRCGDIKVSPRCICKLQCSFELNQETNLVMFYDRSPHQTCQVSGKNPFPFVDGRTRKVVVSKDSNTVIGMGGPNKNLIEFELEWRYAPYTKDMDEALGLRKTQFAVDESLWQTDDLNALDANDTIPPSMQLSHFATPRAIPEQKCRFFPLYGQKLGAGSFGSVTKGYNVDTGSLLAVKTVKFSNDNPTARDTIIMYLKREVEVQCRISHPNIVELLSYREFLARETVCLAMSLEEGNVSALARSPGEDMVGIADAVCKQMLQALDFMAVNHLVHRDIKPANILYRSLPSETGRKDYLFRLADWGLVNYAESAVSNVGTSPFKAPEVVSNPGEEKQSGKVDVWSLFVTVLWILDERRFRYRFQHSRGPHHTKTLVAYILKKGTVANSFRAMGRVNVKKRASAAQMIVKNLGGEGLATPLEEVEELESSDDEAAEDGPGSAPQVLPPTRQQGQTTQETASAGPSRANTMRSGRDGHVDRDGRVRKKHRAGAPTARHRELTEAEQRYLEDALEDDDIL